MLIVVIMNQMRTVLIWPGIADPIAKLVTSKFNELTSHLPPQYARRKVSKAKSQSVSKKILFYETGEYKLKLIVVTLFEKNLCLACYLYVVDSC